MLQTDILELLGIEHPVLLAPMGGVSGGRLVTAVTRAGGFGLVGAGYGDTAWLHRELALCRGQNFGVGFITWALAQDPRPLDIAMEYGASAVMFSFGDCAPYLERLKKEDIKILCQVQTVRQARNAAALGADVIIAQGTEAGGHGGTRSTFTLVPAVVDAVSPTPVVAAGGIADGRGLAAALMLGASGVMVGTRFYASDEALGHERVKAHLIKAQGDETLRTRVFDIVRGLPWPEHFTGRAPLNEFSEKWHGLESSLSEDLEMQSRIYRRAEKEANTNTMVVFAGEAVDLIHRIEPVDSLMKEMIFEATSSFSKIESLQ